MASTLQLGRDGERFAVSCLREAGYTIIARNYRCRYGELDIVARHQGSVVFVEVKTRSGETYGAPEEAVSPAKKRRLVRLAHAFCAARGMQTLPARFDVVSVRYRKGVGMRADIIVNAFGDDL
jgi:putative endonuclease